MRRFWLVFLLIASAQSQVLERLSGTVVFLAEKEQQTVIKDGKPVASVAMKFGTGFLVVDGSSLFLVTAQHVASDMRSERTVTVRGENDTPISMSMEDLIGRKEIRWVFHDKEDVAVAILHPTQTIVSRLSGHFIPLSLLSSDTNAPSRERILTTLGFPLGIGVQEHFSPISRESKPASGLLSLIRPDTHTPAIFFLLDNASVGGFSGAPLFLISTPFASSTGAMVFPETGAPTCVGLINGTISDETGGKMAAVTPSTYIVETIKKASTSEGK